MSNQHFRKFNHDNHEHESESDSGFRLLPRDPEGAAHSRKSDRRAKGLARRARRKDRSALEELHDMFAEDIRAFVSEHIADEGVHEAVCREVWRTVRVEIGEFEEDHGLFKTWLLALVASRWIEIVGRWELRCQPEIPEEDFASSVPAPAGSLDPLDAAELQSCLLQALERVPSREREAFCLRHEDGFTPSEVAALMGLTEEEVEDLVSRCAAKLRRLLGKFNPGNH